MAHCDARRRRVGFMDILYDSNPISGFHTVYPPLRGHRLASEALSL